MEIADILRPENSTFTGSSRAITEKRENKFQQLLDKTIASKEKNSSTANNTNNKNAKAIDKKLMDVCVEMESIFVSRMLKEMRNTLPEEKLINGGFAEKIFEDMLYDQYALSLSKTSNLGLATMLYKELSGK